MLCLGGGAYLIRATVAANQRCPLTEDRGCASHTCDYSTTWPYKHSFIGHDPMMTMRLHLASTHAWTMLRCSLTDLPAQRPLTLFCVSIQQTPASCTAPTAAWWWRARDPSKPRGPLPASFFLEGYFFWLAVRQWVLLRHRIWAKTTPQMHSGYLHTDSRRKTPSWSAKSPLKDISLHQSDCRFMSNATHFVSQFRYNNYSILRVSLAHTLHHNN